MTDRALACTQFRRNWVQITIKGYWGFNCRFGGGISVIYSDPADSSVQLSSEFECSGMVVCPHPLLVHASDWPSVAALNHGSMHIAPSHWNSCPRGRFHGRCTTCPSAGKRRQLHKDPSIQLFTDFSRSHRYQKFIKDPCWFSYGIDVCFTKLYGIAMESISSRAKGIAVASCCCTLSICSLYHIRVSFSTLSVHPAFYRWSESRNVWKAA